MRFDKLKNSLEINSAEAPSIFMAMCLIETIFRDFKDETGLDISNVDPGNETWPLKVAIVYRHLNKICEDNDEKIVRGKKQLDNLRATAVSNEAGLGLLNEIQKMLSNQATINEETERKLREAEANKEKYDALSAEYLRMITRLDEIKNIDPEELSRKLEGIKSEYQSYAREYEDRQKQIDELNHLLEEKTKEMNSQASELSEVRSKLSEADNTIRNIKDELDIIEKSGGVQAKNEEIVKLKYNRDDLKRILREKNSEYESLEAEIEQQRQELEEKDKEVKTKRELKTELGIAISTYNEEYEELRQSVSAKTKDDIELYHRRIITLHEASDSLMKALVSISEITGVEISSLNDVKALNINIEAIGNKINLLREELNSIGEKFNEEFFRS